MRHGRGPGGGPAPFGPLLVVHHEPSWPYDFEYERELQAVAAARFVEGLVAEFVVGAGAATGAGAAGRGRRPPHVVLLGDFDGTPDSAAVRFWTGRQSLGGMSVCYRDAWRHVHGDEPGETFSPANPLVRALDMPQETGRRIDYVMVRCGHWGPTLGISAAERLFVEPVGGVQASDHYGLGVDLEALAAPPGPPG